MKMNASSPQTLSFELPVNPLPADQYAQQLVHNMKIAHFHFHRIKSDLRRRQSELYDLGARSLQIPEGRIVFVHKESHPPGSFFCFVRNFDDPFIVTGHPYNRTDLLTLRNVDTGLDFPRPVKIDKVVVVPDQELNDLRPPKDTPIETDPPPMPSSAALPDLAL